MQGFVNRGDGAGLDDDHCQEDVHENAETHQGVEESDSSEDEVCCIFVFLEHKN